MHDVCTKQTELELQRFTKPVFVATKLTDETTKHCRYSNSNKCYDVYTNQQKKIPIDKCRSVKDVALTESATKVNIF